MVYCNNRVGRIPLSLDLGVHVEVPSIYEEGVMIPYIVGQMQNET